MKCVPYSEIKTPKDVLDDINLRFMSTYAKYKPLIDSRKIEDIAKCKYLKGSMHALQTSATTLDKVLTDRATLDESGDMDLELSSNDCIAECSAIIHFYDTLSSDEYKCTRAEGHSGDHRAINTLETAQNSYGYVIHWAGDMNDEVMTPCISLIHESLLCFSNEWEFFKFLASANDLEYKEGSRSDIEVTISITRRDFDIYHNRRKAVELECRMTGKEIYESNTSDDI